MCVDIGCINQKCQLRPVCNRATTIGEKKFKETAKFKPRRGVETEVTCTYFVNKYPPVEPVQPHVGGGMGATVKKWR